MIKTLELLTGFFTSPVEAVGEIKKEDRLGTAAVVIFFALLSQSAADRMILLNGGKQTSGFFIAGFILTFLSFAVSITLFSMWTHFVAGLLNAQANVKSLLSSVTFSFAPMFLLLPLSSILLAWMPNPLLWYVFAVGVVYTWIACLVYVSIKNVYSLNGGQALLVFASPVILPFLLFIMAVLSVILVITGLFL